MLRLEEVDINLWQEYCQEVLDEIDKIKVIRDEWSENPDPTGEYLAEVRIELTAAASNLNDTMRALVLIEPMWVAKIHRDKIEAMDKAQAEHSSVTKAAAVFKGYDPYNQSLEIQGVVKRVLDFAYATLEQTKNLSNALSSKTKDIYTTQNTKSSPGTDYF